MDEVIEEALEKHQGLVPLVYDAETMALEEARPQDMQYAVYLKREADKMFVEKDQIIEAQRKRLEELENKILFDREHPVSLDEFAKTCGFSLEGGQKAPAKKELVEDTREAVAELKDKYCTHCVICDKPWGAGEMHMLHRITFHGRFITNLYTCCDCAHKIREGES